MPNQMEEIPASKALFNAVQIFGTMLPAVPILLVCLAGLSLTFVHQKRLGKAFPFAALGFGLLIVIYIVFPVIHFTIIRMSVGSVRNIPVAFGIIGFVQSVLHAFALALLGAAVFAGREPGQQ